MSIVEVAKLAKVSTATVSRVINSSGSVKPETVARVKKIMTQLGYVPKPLVSRPGNRLGSLHDDGRKLHKKTGTIALVMCMKPSFLGLSPVLSSAVHGVEEALIQRGLNMIQVYVQPDAPIPPILTQNGIDGSLVIHAMPENVETILNRHQRVTLMSESSSHSDHIFCDNAAIGELAFNYLKERGHEHIAFVTLHKEHVAYTERKESFCNLASQSELMVDVFEHPNRWGDELLSNRNIMESMCDTTAEQMSAMSDRPTGLFVTSDAFAAVLYPALNRVGIRPGRDVDIISCNNESMLLAGLSPRPATIDIKAEYIGQRAVEQLCWRMEHPDDLSVIEIKIRPGLVANEG